VQDAESFDGTTWVDGYNIVGTWDGTAFTLTELPTIAAEPLFDRDYETPTDDCDREDYRPVLDFIDTLDREALGIVGGGSDVWDGRCGATIEAYFDTPELREAISPMSDRIVTYFLMEEVDPG
jgi:hypothetical protein